MPDLVKKHSAGDHEAGDNFLVKNAMERENSGLPCWRAFGGTIAAVLAVVQTKEKMTASQTSGQGGPRLSRLRLAVMVAFWLAAVLGGSAAMWTYEFTSGDDPHAPKHWPAGSRISRAAGHATLVVFAHPQCPCTAATLEELARIMAAAGTGTSVSTLFFTPPEAATEWMQTPTVRRAAAIPGVTVIADDRGREAKLFHAITSGRTLLYDPNGELLFDGGITGSRGHVGENAGTSALIALLTRGSNAPATTPVFGCSILQPVATRDCTSCKP